jgi:hypothetical protein
VTAEADGTATVEAAGLPAGHEYTVWVDGVWVAEPWEEPPFIGNGGNFTPLGTVQLAASADFALQPCPAPAAGPATPAKAAELAATGSGDAGGMLGGALLLFGIGGAALIAARRREVVVRDRG